MFFLTFSIIMYTHLHLLLPLQWFFRARKKLKKQQEDAANQPAPPSTVSSAAASTVQAMATISGPAPTTQQHNHSMPPPQTSFPNISPMQGSKASAVPVGGKAIIPTSTTSAVTGTLTSQTLPNAAKSKSSTPGLTDKAKAYMTRWLSGKYLGSSVLCCYLFILMYMNLHSLLL